MTRPTVNTHNENIPTISNFIFKKYPESTSIETSVSNATLAS